MEDMDEIGVKLALHQLQPIGILILEWYINATYVQTFLRLLKA